MISTNIQFGIEIEPKGKTPAFTHQVHSDQILEIYDPTQYQASLQLPRDADAVISYVPNLPVHIFTADCMPVMLWNDVAVAAVHCGWRGAAAGIVKKAAAKLEPPFLAAVGPTLLPCCFEVREDFIETFRTQGHAIEAFLRRDGGHIYFDLPGFVLETQLSAAESVDLSGLRCTFCSPDSLPSYRRNGGTDPRIRSWIQRNYP